MSPPRVVEPEQVALRVLFVAVVVGADLGDLAVLDPEPLRAAIEALLAGLRVAPGHRPLDHGFVAGLDPVLEPPLAVDGLDAPRRVFGDLAAMMWAEARVVVGCVVDEMSGHRVGVARVERLVVGADVVEMRDCAPDAIRSRISTRLSNSRGPVRHRVERAASGASQNRKECR